MTKRNKAVTGGQFLPTYQKAVHDAAHTPDPDPIPGTINSVFMYRDPAGIWHIAGEGEEVPNALYYLTEGYLQVWADGEVGIVCHVPTARAMGKKGGSAQSEAKAAAARINQAKSPHSGRPPKDGPVSRSTEYRRKQKAKQAEKAQ